MGALAAVLIVSSFPMASCSSAPREGRQKPATQAAQPRKATFQNALRKTKPYTVKGVTYYPLEDSAGFSQTGVASWYGRKFHGRKTANGETYDMYKMTAAHKTLPMGTMVEVRSLDSGMVAVVRINDRGPFARSRIIDLSMAAADSIGMKEQGTARVTVTALAEGRPGGPGQAPQPVRPLQDFKTGVFWVQVGAFGVRENAERVRERLLFPRNEIKLFPFVNDMGLTLHRVRVGPFKRLDMAEMVLQAAVDQGFMESFVVAD